LLLNFGGTSDVITGGDYGSEALAEATGAPASWFDDKYLEAPLGDVISTLGKMTLTYLSSLRNSALADGPAVNVRENSLKAVETMAEALLMNEKLGHGTQY
jgi:hypothetical protein